MTETDKLNSQSDVAQSEQTQATSEVDAEADNSEEAGLETGEIEDDGPQQQPPEYRWCKCFYEPEQPGAQNYYFMHFDTRETKYEEPNEPYWIWDAMLNNVHASGLQHPSSLQQNPPALGTSSAGQSSEVDPEYQGYNPKIHGSYDPNAPYAQYHKQKVAEAQALKDYTAAAASVQAGEYGAVGAFNRFSGGFQTADKSTERHDDFNKSGRQLNNFFDVDAAANSHDGKSLKDERRAQKPSKKEIAEMSKKRRDKKEKKRLDFYKS
ncbi:hypothetical protein LTR36_004373 [Oleoguttula mirabilis]|uniref:WW domain-containing protein n=1 Tax=Oleoguttula mirabilis TaxID=1507867 RepID=A0AAV9JG22_9PEZI|nr:hypothetical protein LTR36_004373 [Oleoguttula mirabilis]